MTIQEQLAALPDDELRKIGEQLSRLKERRDQLDAALPGARLPDASPESALNCAESRIEGGDVRQLIGTLTADFDAMERLAGVR